MIPARISDNRSIGQAIARQAGQSPETGEIVFIHADRSPAHIRFGELHSDAVRYAGWLLKQGIQPGDLLLLACDHDQNLVVAFVAALYLGAVPTIFPYPVRYSGTEIYSRRLRSLISTAHVRAVLTTPALQATLEMSIEHAGGQVLPVDLSLARANTDFRIYPADPTSIALVQYSSGTTGDPKGILMSHDTLLAHLKVLAHTLPFRKDDVHVGWAPFYHDLGLVIQLLFPLVIGGKSVCINPHYWVRRPRTLLHAIDQYRGTICVMPNFGYSHTVRHIREKDLEGISLKSLHTLLIGGEVVQTTTIDMFQQRFFSYGLRENVLRPAYGLAENGFAATIVPSGQAIRIDSISQQELIEKGQAVSVSSDARDVIDVVSCGVPIRETTILIVDEHERQVAERHVGEVVISGSSICSGYHKNPELSAKTLKDGRLFTNDIGYMADGHLYIVDRKNDLMIVGGKNLYPESIERIAREKIGPRIGHAVAFGLQNEQLGTEQPVLVCELRRRLDESDTQHLARRIRQQVRADLGVGLADLRFVKRGWVIKTTSGKIARSANRRKYIDSGFSVPVSAEQLQQVVSVPLSHEDVEQQLITIFEKFSGISMNVRENFLESGLDSIQYMRVFSVIEQRFAQPLPMDAVLANPTITHLAQIIRHQAPSEVFAAPIQYTIRSNPFTLLKKMYKTPLSLSEKLSKTYSILKNHLFEIGPDFLDYTVPYAAGSKFLAWFCRQLWGQRRFFTKQVRLVQHCYNALHCSGDEAELIPLSIANNFWLNWRFAALANCSFEQLKRWVTVSGFSIVQEASRQEHGVIVVSSHSA